MTIFFLPLPVIFALSTIISQVPVSSQNTFMRHCDLKTETRPVFEIKKENLPAATTFCFIVSLKHSIAVML